MVVDKSNERVRKMFGEIAPKYDRMNHLLSMNVDRYWRWKAVRKTGTQSGPIPSSTCARERVIWHFHSTNTQVVKFL